MRNSPPSNLPAPTASNYIKVRGARTHNLKNIDIDIPRNQLVVITGLSGSGKSSLAFDTLYAEGQRRYVESLSAYARQFLQLMEKPDVDLIEGLSPAISIEQKASSHNPRSTVGTVTEVYDYLRLLFARVGIPYCPDHPEHPLQGQSVSQMADAILALPNETQLMVLSPVLSNRKGEHLELFSSLQTQGFTRVRIQTEQEAPHIEELDGLSLPKLARQKKHSVEVVVDRIKITHPTEAIRQRLIESLETSLRLSQDRVKILTIVEATEKPLERLFSSQFACPACGHSLPELEPRLFSFNNPLGACPNCNGLGIEQFFDWKRIVQHPDLSLASGAIKGWDKRNPQFFRRLLELSQWLNFDLEAPFETLDELTQQIVLFGTNSARTKLSQQLKKLSPFEGIVHNFERRYQETDLSGVKEDLARYINTRTCPDCKGSRLRKDVCHVRVGPPGQDRAIFEISSWSLGAALTWFENLELPSQQQRIGGQILHEISNRLRFLNNVGLNYLSIDRSADTLSGGELQRIRLASQIGSGLTGVMYVLDEPSIGLHQRDNDRLIDTLKHLRNIGNSVLVVEHDEDAIRCADHVIDMGPGAGEHGGQIIAEGTPASIEANLNSLTGEYLSGARCIEIPTERHLPTPGHYLRIVGAHSNNLKHISVEIPIGLLICVTGVSGSGKSTLVNDTLYANASRNLYGFQKELVLCERIDGLEAIDKIVNVDQSPIGRTPRSNPATYTGLFTPLRELFSEMPLAKERGYGPGRFSFNVRGGRCEACEGEGTVKVAMHFLADLHVPCEVCKQQRYNTETLAVRYKGKNIAEVLHMTVAQAAEFLSAVPAIHRRLQTLLEVGLGYIRLGQASTTLSGGEAQRIKLSEELSKRSTGRTLYVLDEPTTGLHFHDVALLLKVIHTLRNHGNTVVVIEHNLDVIKTADWVVDLGPEGGADGGQVLAEGPPETIAKCAESHTGQYLKRVLAKNPLVKN